MKAKLAQARREVVGLLGIGLDGDDHQRITSVEHFFLVGGSEATHGLACKMRPSNSMNRSIAAANGSPTPKPPKSPICSAKPTSKLSSCEVHMRPSLISTAALFLTCTSGVFSGDPQPADARKALQGTWRTRLQFPKAEPLIVVAKMVIDGDKLVFHYEMNGKPLSVIDMI